MAKLTWLGWDRSANNCTDSTKPTPDYPTAESIMNRLKNNAYKVELKDDASMRKRCVDKELRAYAEQTKD